jgi:hypothetical protein
MERPICVVEGCINLARVRYQNGGWIRNGRKCSGHARNGKERKRSEGWKRRKQQRRIARYRGRVAALKEDRPCADCGRQFSAVCMDFHHVRGIKKFTIGKKETCGVRALLEEVAKCELICACCHRLRHARERGEKATYCG